MSVELLGQVSVNSAISLPLFSQKVSAGFPSPAQDYVERTLDLNQLCIKHPAATFFVKVSGDSMKAAGIFDGDVLGVDRSIQGKHGAIVVASLNGEFTVKELCTKPTYKLIPSNPDYPIIEIKPSDDFAIIGVVICIVRIFNYL